MKILGIDPGTAITGYACLEYSQGSFKLHKHGCIKTAAGKDLAERLHQIYRQVSRLMDDYQPEHIAMERQFFNRNVTSALFVGHASGVILLAAAERKIPVSMYTPLQVKMAVAGYGKADKKQIQYMVKNLVGLRKIPRPDDMADAIAVAICHVNRSSFNSRIEEIEGK